MFSIHDFNFVIFRNIPTLFCELECAYLTIQETISEPPSILNIIALNNLEFNLLKINNKVTNSCTFS